jgi:hypothetical protein
MKISKSFRNSQRAVILAAINNSRHDLPMPGLQKLRVKSTTSKDYEGWAFVDDKNTATIAIHRALKGAALFATVAHEMTHISQYLRGDLESVDHKRLRWKGKVYKLSNKRFKKMTLKQYKKLPWEKEAYKYCERFFKSDS